MLHFLESITRWEAFGLFLFENVIIVVVTLLISNWLTYGLSIKQLSKLVDTLTSKEVLLAFTSVIINTIITYAGYECWKSGYIQFDESISYRIVVDSLILILTMDAVMFFLHYIVHRTFLYSIVHKLHHMYTNPQPIDLFVLHPFETFSFGSLWVILLLVFPANLYAVILYLILNVIFGMLGHMNIELFPANWVRIPIVKQIATATFHYQHHQNEQYNFGFYTTFWDSLFGTLAPDYMEQFQRNREQSKER
ncbi:sterol desaturase family protein [Cytophagaceae bacterium DM2B3-1]|uniref:Sterol desaturase family protein n=1 Tax=Xanthocytophaga flava TaxID=3048013 RepID=A0ABT7CF06_9BACT|nr:sterol desaturase family protein [Xanthocytophaga flavus]MDJ1492326.1 sterol desaturase family protein [Xanthocytophaga flavus]